MCSTLPTDTHLALAMLKLTMPASLQYVGHLFGVGKATTREAILEASQLTMACLEHCPPDSLLSIPAVCPLSSRCTQTI
ncbi:hypothetical protein Y1Q_0005116 [Alligator mississippiensis]|uniref:DDE Tnp4 domain-containing protein n=1 Tax=Alligator mississippiensis TaxID=8496 RepID=A0A151MUC4_ALLMI|nr:hypothetical protein Y1Q_0005116 [Alligator mississippiensis]